MYDNYMYIELVFLDNFLLDGLVCLITLRVLEIRLPFLRITLAAALGGIFAAAGLFAPEILSWWGRAACVSAISLVLCAPFAWVKLIKICGVFLAISLTLGGIIFAINWVIFAEKTVITQDRLRLVLIGVVTFIIIIEALIRRRSYSGEWEISAMLGTDKVRFIATFDSGNEVRDLGGQGVIIVGKQIVFEKLGEATKKNIESYAGTPLIMRTFKIQTISGEGEYRGVLADVVLTQGKRRIKTRCYIVLCEDMKTSIFGQIRGTNV